MFDRFKKLRKRKSKKLKTKDFPEINKGNLENFLKEITKSVDANFSGKESVQLQKFFQNELNAWVEQTILAGKPLDTEAVKVGVILGLKEALRKINEVEEETRVTYIS